MGCDFEFIIQVLHGTTWVNVVRFGTKTSCGGFPLWNATCDLYKEKAIEGNFHAEEPIAFTINEALVAMGFAPIEVNTPMKCRRVYFEQYHDEGEETSASTNKETSQYKPSYLYYSIDDVKQLIPLIEPLRYDRLGEPLAKPDFGYQLLLKTMPRWMDMAKVAFPDDEEIWMSEEPQWTTECIVKQQETMRVKYTQLLIQTMPSNLPKDLIRYIALFAIPYGSEVRLSWNDDEGRCDALVRAIRGNVVKDQASRNKIVEEFASREEPCVIM
jgi:hypothetical protein